MCCMPLDNSEAYMKQYDIMAYIMCSQYEMKGI